MPHDPIANVFMLAEIPHVKQYEPTRRRRWFQDDYFDLFVWQDDQGAFTGFQLCYDRSRQQRALSWSVETGWRHEGVNQPEEKPGRAMSALFVADGVLDRCALADRFRDAAVKLPEDVRRFVHTRIDTAGD